MDRCPPLSRTRLSQKNIPAASGLHVRAATNIRRTDWPHHMHRQTLSRVLIDQHQHAKAGAAFGLVFHKVPAPDIAAMRRALALGVDSPTRRIRRCFFITYKPFMRHIRCTRLPSTSWPSILPELRPPPQDDAKA